MLYSHKNKGTSLSEMVDPQIEHSKRLERNGWPMKDTDYVMFTLKKACYDFNSFIVLSIERHGYNVLFGPIGCKTTPKAQYLLLCWC